MANIYILRGLGMGDDENAFENLGAFSSEEKALACIDVHRQEDKELGIETVYDVEVLELDYR